MPPFAGARSRPSTPPGRSPSGARRPSSTALVGQTVDADPPAGQVPRGRPRPRPGRGQSDAHGPLPARRPPTTSSRRRPPSSGRSVPARGRGRRAPPAAWTTGRGLAAGRRRTRGDPLPRPDPDGQGLPPADRRRAGRSRARAPASIGPEADDPALTLEAWRERIRRHPGELKNLLRNQAFVAGIGNAYSDEILHAARLLPFRKRSSLAPEEVDALYDATRSTLAIGDRGAARAGAADLRGPGPRLPGGPQQGRSGRARAAARASPRSSRRVRDLVLPRLPALSDGQRSRRTCPTRSESGP